MRKLILLIAALMVSTSFAGNADIQSLSSAWKAQPLTHHKKDKNDITIVYGGADVAPKSSLMQSNLA